MLASVLTGIAAAGFGAGTGLYTWGAVAPSSQLFGPTIRRLNDRGAIALTFDDGPNPAITPQLLDLLDRYSARATFFVIGRNVREFPQLAKEIADRGHTLGNHTDSHPHLTFLPAERIAAELRSCKESVLEAAGREPRWMRPPYGFRSLSLNPEVIRSGCSGVVMWSALAWDWKTQPADRIIARLRRVKGGDIVLLHDGDHRVFEGDRRHTVGALEYWLPRWKDAGIRFRAIDG